MAAKNYQEALRRLLLSEGGYTNEATDPGGPTNFGITIWDYRKYISSNGTADDVRHMSLDQAKQIYKVKYWDAIRADDLPSGVDYAVFDYGVNSGISKAVKVLQIITGAAPIDGKVGDKTIAVAQKADPKATIAAICDERMHFLRSLHNWPTYAKGWTIRVNGVRAAAQAMVDNKTPSV